MPNPIQKEFRLERADKAYSKGDDETMTLVTIRQATPEQNLLRETFLSKVREECITFLKEGNKNGNNYRPVYEITGNEYIDDMHNRFKWIKRRIKDEIISYEFSLTVIECNILDYWDKKPLVEFIDGQVHGYIHGLSDDLRDEIHEKVLELNSAWSGEFERICDSLKAIIPSLQKTGKFQDLTLISVFSKSKTYLDSLMKEINEDVFDNKGSIKVNVPTEALGGNKKELLWALKNTNPPLENIILYYSPNPKRDKNSYIGVLEHGKFEIRVVARRDKFNYWDTNIEGVIETLREAIEWWKNKSAYSQNELDDIAETAAYNDALEDGKAFRSEMQDYGYDEDDF